MRATHVFRLASCVLCFFTGSALAQIALYEHDNYAGRVHRSSSAEPNLGITGFNDKASSAVVRNGRWQLCSDANFRGQCVTLEPGEYPSLSAMGLNDKVSSVQETGGRPAPGYGAAPGYGGNNPWGGNAYNPSSTDRLKAKATGHCRLINVSYGRDVYNGLCGIKQSVDGNQNRFSIRMGNSEPYVFVSQGSNWLFLDPRGNSLPARFKDLGHNAVFRWAEWRLEVDEDL